MLTRIVGARSWVAKAARLPGRSQGPSGDLGRRTRLWPAGGRSKPPSWGCSADRLALSVSCRGTYRRGNLLVRPVRRPLGGRRAAARRVQPRSYGRLAYEMERTVALQSMLKMTETNGSSRGLYLQWEGKRIYRQLVPTPRLLEPVEKYSVG